MLEFIWSLNQMILKAQFSRGPERFLRSMRPMALRDLDGRRFWMAALGMSWQAGLILTALLWLFGWATSWAGLWAYVWAPARSPEPPMWIFWLGDARLGGLLFCSLIGFIPARLARVGGWAWVLAPAGIFAGVFSLAGAWVMILAERLALWARWTLQEDDPALRMDFITRFLVAVFVWAVLLFEGAAFRDMVQYALGDQGRADTHVGAGLIGLVWVLILETVLAMVVFHFRYAITAKSSRGENTETAR